MCTCESSTSAAAEGPGATVPTAPPVVPPEVPLAGGLVVEVDGESPAAGAHPGPLPGPTPGPTPVPPLRPCHTDLRQGCYTISFRPNGSRVTFRGTLRVDRSAPDGGPDSVIVSGDLYRYPAHPLPGAGLPTPTDAAPGTFSAATETLSAAAAASRPTSGADASAAPAIPAFPRARYASYLKVVTVSVPRFAPSHGGCGVTLVAEQYDYTQPPAGSFKGSFPSAPSRTVTLRLRQLPGPFPGSGSGPAFAGDWLEGGAVRGTVALTWVSRFFRRATVEIDTLAGAVAPVPVPDGAGGSEYFDTIYAKHGWDLTVVRDEVDVPVPGGVDPTACWSAANLHALMAARRSATTDLDREWRIHLMMVPARLGCGRGVMYDQIVVPREGCASFSDDGYPSGDSANFGTAENRPQRDVPRAFLRSATHEITHTFNQIHQEQETVADNSIMSTTPSVADVLGGPTTGAPGVFPDQIELAVNATVRHHLNHMPDPVIRPGGWPFASWFGGGVPQASDRFRFADDELALDVRGPASVAFGEPLALSWTLTNRGATTLVAPNDVSLEGLFASISITDATGRSRAFRAFVIRCESVKLAGLAPGEAVSADARVFWQSEGFAFPRAGQYRVTVSVNWSARGVPVTVSSDHDVFVDFPTSVADNRAAALVLDDEVGRWVALGGDAYHLTGATRRLAALADLAGRGDVAAPALMSGFDGLLPDPDRLP